MTIADGTRLGHYLVKGPLGAGGMGEVYRATDTRLGRDVAIKVLPPEVAGVPGRLARFEREARVLATLNHPNVGAIHGLEEAEGKPFLVLELVEGEDLAARLARGPLTVDEAIGIGRQIAEALAAAHDNGVVHRDLKPGNVQLTPGGTVKVLDFGLAAHSGGAGVDPSEQETATRGLTLAGTVLGTPAYMSPEQARGQHVGPPSDLWSLGCVLFEMLGGRRPFEGPTVSDLIAAVLTHEPDWKQLPRETPPALARMLRRTFDRSAERRPSARELCQELARTQDERRLGATGGRRALPWIAALLALALAGWWLLGRRAPSGTAGATSRPRSLAQLTFASELEQWPAFSPDGRRLLYSAERDGYAQLVLKDLASGEERRLTSGDRDDTQPAWSPDGRTLAFVRASGPRGKLEISDALSGAYNVGDVWLLELETGREERIIEEAFNPAFSPDGRLIAVDMSRAGPRRIWTTDARGRNPRQVTSDSSEAVQHTRPAWSPDGTRLVFQHEEKTKLDVRVALVATGAVTTVTDDLYLDLDPAWSPSGAYVYFSSYRGGGLNVWRIPVDGDGGPTGPPEQLTTGAGQDIQPSLSRDGERLAFTVLSQNADLYRLALDPTTGAAAGQPEPFVVSTREDSRGAWSPDGRLVAFNSDRDGEMNVWVHSLADGKARPLTRGPGGDYQPRWSPDGREVAFFSSRSGNADVWTVDVASGAMRQVTTAPGLDVNPFFSPDGRTIAFQSDRDGRKEVWLADRDGGNVRQLGRVGAADHFMRWSDDGRLLYFRSTALNPNGVVRAPAAGGDAEPLGLPVGWHMSFSPDRSLILDVTGHKSMAVYPLDGGPPRPVFASSDADVRIDYPEWSPDGRYVVFDRVSPQGGDVWLLAGLE